MPDFKEANFGELSIKAPDLSQANLLLWLNSRQNVTLSGADVTQWQDYRSNGTIFTSSPGSRPTQSSVNGITSVFVNGSQTMQNTTLSLPNQYSVFAVANRSSGSGFQRLVNFSTGDFVLYLGTSSGNYATFSGGGSSWNDTTANSPATAVDSSLVRLTATNNNSSLVPYVNSTAQTAKTGNTTTATGMILFTGAGGGASQFWAGNLLELVVYSGVVSNDDRQAVWDYLIASNSL